MQKMINKFRGEVNIFFILKTCLFILFPFNAFITIVYYGFFDNTVEHAVIMEITNLKHVIDDNAIVKYTKVNNYNFFAEIIVKNNDETNLEAVRNYLVQEGYSGGKISDKASLNNFFWEKGRKGRYYIIEKHNAEDTDVIFEVKYRTGKGTVLQELLGI